MQACEGTAMFELSARYPAQHPEPALNAFPTMTAPWHGSRATAAAPDHAFPSKVLHKDIG
jgi:hypothetical protein